MKEDGLAGCFGAVVGTVLDLNADRHRPYVEPGDAKNRLDPAAEKTMQRHIPVARVPENLRWRESFDLSESTQNLADPCRAVLFGKPPCGRKIAKPLEIGGFRALLRFHHLGDETAGMKRERGVQLITTDLSPFKLTEELRGSGIGIEVHGRDTVSITPMTVQMKNGYVTQYG